MVCAEYNDIRLYGGNKKRRVKSRRDTWHTGWNLCCGGSWSSHETGFISLAMVNGPMYQLSAGEVQAEVRRKTFAQVERQSANNKELSPKPSHSSGTSGPLLGSCTALWSMGTSEAANRVQSKAGGVLMQKVVCELSPWEKLALKVLVAMADDLEETDNFLDLTLRLGMISWIGTHGHIQVFNKSFPQPWYKLGTPMWDDVFSNSKIEGSGSKNWCGKALRGSKIQNLEQEYPSSLLKRQCPTDLSSSKPGQTHLSQLIKVLLAIIETCRQVCSGKLELNSAGHLQDHV